LSFILLAYNGWLCDVAGGAFGFERLPDWQL